MPETTVSMKDPDGDVGVVQLPDARSVQSDSSGVYAVPSKYVSALINAGWTIQITGNPPTHVP
jgi:hypothetical protein